MKPDVLYKTLPHFTDSLQIIHTPGHSPGSICLLEKTSGTLFTGDTAGGNKKGEIQDYYHNDLATNLQSCAKLLKYDFQHILPFHYNPIMNTGKKALEKYVESKKIK